MLEDYLDNNCTYAGRIFFRSRAGVTLSAIWVGKNLESSARVDHYYGRHFKSDGYLGRHVYSLPDCHTIH